MFAQISRGRTARWASSCAPSCASAPRPSMFGSPTRPSTNAPPSSAPSRRPVRCRPILLNIAPRVAPLLTQACVGPRQEIRNCGGARVQPRSPRAHDGHLRQRRQGRPRARHRQVVRLLLTPLPFLLSYFLSFFLVCAFVCDALCAGMARGSTSTWSRSWKRRRTRRVRAKASSSNTFRSALTTTATRAHSSGRWPVLLPSHFDLAVVYHILTLYSRMPF